MLEMSLTSAKDLKQYYIYYNFEQYKFQNHYGKLSPSLNNLLTSLEQLFVKPSILIKKAIYFSKQSIYYILFLITCSYLLALIGSVNENDFLQWIGIGFGTGLTILELLFIYFVKYLKNDEVKKMIEQGHNLTKKHNEKIDANLICRLQYSLGTGMKYFFRVPVICFEINLVSPFDNLSQVLDENEKERKIKAKQIKTQFGIQKKTKGTKLNKKISCTEFSNEQYQKRETIELL